MSENGQLNETEQLAEELLALYGRVSLAESVTAREILGEPGWRLAGVVTDPRLITLTEVNDIVIRARMAALLSPVITAGLNVLKLFTFGQGVAVKAADPDIDQVIQQFLSDKSNRSAFTGHRARQEAVANLHTDGNLYTRFFPGPRTKIRTIDQLEIVDICTNPEDLNDPWLYIRSYVGANGAPVTVAYPDVNYNPRNRMAVQLPPGVSLIRWETPVHHTAVNKVGKWGVCSFLAALNWAKEYERFLEHRATLYAAYAAIGLLIKDKINRLAAVRNRTDNQGKSTVKGATATLPPEGSIEAVDTRAATTPPSEGVQFLEMVMMVFNFPPHMFGKEEPGGMGERGRHQFFKLRIESERTAWKEDYQDILDYVLLQAVKNGRLRANIVRDGNDELIVWPQGVDPTINIVYPPITEEDTKAAIETIIAITTLNGQKPVGHIGPREFMAMVTAHLKIGVDTEALPETWPADTSEVEAFLSQIKQAIGDEPAKDTDDAKR